MENDVIDEAREDGTDPEVLAAFEAGFAGTASKPPQKDVPADGEAPPEEGKAAAAPAPAQAKAKKEVPAEAEVDPFADLPEPVRVALARVTTLEHDVRTTRERLSASEGRIAAFQREREASQRTAPAPAATDTPPNAPTPAQKAPKREQVRGELPEVAEALDELDEKLAALRAERDLPKSANAPAPTPEASPAAAPSSAEDREAEALTRFDPDWGTKLSSTAYSLWLSTQPEQVRNTAMSTNRAIDLLAVLKDFDKFTAGVATRTRQQTETSNRRSTRTERAAALPSAGARGLPTRQMTEDEAFEYGFKQARSGNVT